MDSTHSQDVDDEAAYITLSRCFRQFIEITGSAWAEQNYVDVAFDSELLFESVGKWMNYYGSSTLAVVGAPRSGKTFLLRTIAAENSITEAVVISFTFEHLGVRQVSNTTFPGLLLWQLLTQRSDLVAHLDSAKQKYGPSLFCSDVLLWKVLCATLNDIHDRVVLLLIDGLDRCPENLRLQDLLEDIQSRCKMKLLVSSQEPVVTTFPLTVLSTESVMLGAQSSVAECVIQDVKDRLGDVIVNMSDGGFRKLRNIAIISSSSPEGVDFLRPRLLITWAILKALKDEEEQNSSLFVNQIDVIRNAQSGIESDSEVLMADILKKWSVIAPPLITICALGPIPARMFGIPLDKSFTALLFTKVNDKLDVVHHFIADMAGKILSQSALTRLTLPERLPNAYISIVKNTISEIAEFTSSQLSEIDSALYMHPDYKFCVENTVAAFDWPNLKFSWQNVAQMFFDIATKECRIWNKSVLSYTPLSANFSSELSGLHMAVISGSSTIVSLFLNQADSSTDEKGQKVKDNLGRSPLHYAALLGNNAAAGLLMNYQYRISDLDEEGYSALELACWEGNGKMVLSMLDYISRAANEAPMFNLDDENTERALFLLQLVRKSGKKLPIRTILSIMRVLDEETAKQLVTNPWDWRLHLLPDRSDALHIASYVGNTLMVQFLLGRELQPANISCSWGTALHIAIKKRHEIIANLLLEGTNNPDAVDTEGKTALHCAVSFGSVKLVLQLLHQGWNHAARDKNGNTPLHYAVTEGNVRLVNILLRRMRIPLDENGDEIESQFDSFSNSAGQSPADIAFCARNMEMMINLAQKRILPLKTDQDGMSAIQYACRASNSALIRSLLSTSSHSVVNSSTDAKQHLEILVWEEQSELLEIVLSLCDKSEIESFFNRASSAGQHHVVERILSTRAFDMQNTWDAAWKACCEHDFHEVARVLLRYWKIYYGINLPEYHTAIEKANSRAAVVGATGCLRCLIQEAWNVCFQKSGIERMAASCLSQAIKSKTLSTVELLLKDGGLNGGELQDQRHNPPILFLAISSKSLPITKAIVREGVNLSNIFQNQSALDWSTNHGSEAITAYLKDKGCKSTGLLPLVNQTRSPNRSLALTTEPFLELPSHRYHNREDVILPSRLNESVEVRRGDQNRDSNQLVELEGDFYMPDEFHRQSIISDIEVPTSDTLVRSISLRQSRNTSPLPPSSSAYQLTDQYSYPVHEQRSNNMRTSPGSLRTDRQEDEPQIESSGTARQERSKSKKPGLRGQDFERIRRIFQNKSKRRH